jgi:hypothetical protein
LSQPSPLVNALGAGLRSKKAPSALAVALAAANPKPKPSPAGGKKKPAPLPGYPTRRGLDEPTQWKGKPKPKPDIR